MKYNGTGEIIGSCFSMILFPLTILSVLSIFKLLRNTNPKDPNPKLSSLTDNLTVKVHRLTIYWNFLSLLRWILTCLSLYYLRDYPTLQVFSLYYLSLFWTCLTLRLKPCADPLDNKVTVFNEIMSTSYLMMMMNILQTDVDRTQWAIISVLIITVSINILKFLHGVVR